MDIKEFDVQIRNIAKTKEGDIKILMKGETKKFCQNVRTKLQDLKVEEKSRTETLVIRDLDKAVTIEEVKECILEERGESNLKIEEIKVVSLRINILGPAQTAIVVVPETTAEVLLKKKRIRVGWTRCRVERKISPTRCHKCQEFGHIAMNCKAKVALMSNKCYKCCRAGHIARNCNAEPQCYMCKEKGHRANSMKCPHFKKAMEMMVREARR